MAVSLKCRLEIGLYFEDQGQPQIEILQVDKKSNQFVIELG